MKERRCRACDNASESASRSRAPRSAFTEFHTVPSSMLTDLATSATGLPALLTNSMAGVPHDATFAPFPVEDQEFSLAGYPRHALTTQCGASPRCERS